MTHAVRGKNRWLMGEMSQAVSNSTRVWPPLLRGNTPERNPDDWLRVNTPAGITNPNRPLGARYCSTDRATNRSARSWCVATFPPAEN